MASSDRSRSPTTTSARNRPAFPAPRQDLPGFPKRCGPMGSAVRTLHNMMPRPQIPNRWPLLPSGPYGVLWGIESIWKSSSTTSIDDPVGPDRHIHFHPLHQHHCLMHPFPAHPLSLARLLLPRLHRWSVHLFHDPMPILRHLQRLHRAPTKVQGSKSLWLRFE